MSVLIAVLYIFVYTAYSDNHAISVTIDGFVDHGTNAFNGEFILDLTVHSNLFGQLPPFATVATLPNCDSEQDSTEPTASTDRNSVLATLPGPFALADFLHFGDIPPEYYSICIMDVGVMYSGSTTIAKRIKVKPFNEATTVGSGIRASPFVNWKPTLGDFEAITGSLNIDCNDKYNKLEFNIQNGFPNMLYTVWELYITNPLSANEGGASAPGTLPNIIITDKNGNGKLTQYLPYCPYNTCQTAAQCGSECPDCVLGYVMLVHWDWSAYGGISAFERTDPALYSGFIASQQLSFWTSSQIVGNKITVHDIDGDGGDDDDDDSSDDMNMAFAKNNVNEKNMDDVNEKKYIYTIEFDHDMIVNMWGILLVVFVIFAGIIGCWCYWDRCRMLNK